VKALKVFFFGLLIFGFCFTLGLWWPAESVVDHWPEIPEDPELYFSVQDENQAVLDPSMKKQVLRAESPKNTVVVYLHGWSASPMEIYPVPQDLPKKLNLSVVLQRLSGHGLGTKGFRNITAQKLWNDTLEAIAVAEKLGNQIILVGCSTGASLAIDFAARFPNRVHGLILISPNFKLKVPGGDLLSGPLGKVWARLVVGEYREWQAKTENIRRYWTRKYASDNISAMMETIKRLNSQDLNKISIPVLTFMTKKDEVIDVDFATQKIQSFGSKRNEIVWLETEAHVPFGTWQSPQTTVEAEAKIHEFLRRYDMANSY
jgi:esterase/lipase